MDVWADGRRERNQAASNPAPKVWLSYCKRSITRIRSVQHSMPRYILPDSNLSDADRCEPLDLILLSFWHEIQEVVFLYLNVSMVMLMHISVLIEFQIWDNVPNLSLCSRIFHQLHAYFFYTWTETFKCFFFFFFNRIVLLWSSSIECSLILQCQWF